MRNLAPFALALVLLTSSCSSIRMRYAADLETGDGRKGTYVFEKSYTVETFPVFCGVTAIFLGGACWFYLVMPTVPQVNKMQNDAHAQLEELLGPSTTYTIRASQTDRMNWEDQKQYTDLRMPE